MIHARLPVVQVAAQCYVVIPDGRFHTFGELLDESLYLCVVVGVVERLGGSGVFVSDERGHDAFAFPLDVAADALALACCRARVIFCRPN